MRSGFALSIFGHALILLLIIGVEFYRTPNFIIPTNEVISIELISEVELNRDSILAEENVEPSDMELITEAEDEPQEITEFVQPVIPDLKVQPNIAEVPANIQTISPELPQPIEPPGVKIGVPEGITENIVIKDPTPLPKANEFKLPEITKVTSEYNPLEKPELKVAEITQEATSPSEETVLELETEPVEESTTEEATTPITVTEANKSEEATVPSTDLKVTSNLLALGSPTSRPKDFTVSEDLDLDSVISQILEETTPSEPVQAEPEPEPVALTTSEIERLRRLIVDNWNIGALSSEAKRVILTVRIRMDETGKPIEIELYNSDGGVNDKAVEVAFEVARRAITKGLENGHDLPKEKYDLWKEVLYTFNPEQMRNR
ncbi:MAG: hypothetical protein OXH90_04665 [Paracoccaceae bacterium]|nr:hypothetical protein [Paracoccaceae bacterium]MDE2916492.1 hypothetical protein [Paracoccaceae bacterium]